MNVKTECPFISNFGNFASFGNFTSLVTLLCNVFLIGSFPHRFGFRRDMFVDGFDSIFYILDPSFNNLEMFEDTYKLVKICVFMV